MSANGDDRWMDPATFRRWGYETVDWIARYMEEVSTHPVRSQTAPGDISERLPPMAPEVGEDFGEILADLDRIVLPGITHWQSPNFFAYFPANTSGPSILGDLVCAGLGVQGMLWSTSPACTEIESRVMDWMAKLLGLPERFAMSGAGGGVIQDSASSATLCAALAARERATGGLTNREGVGAAPAPLVAYASVAAHSSIEKGLRIAGIGDAQLRKIGCDAAGAIDVEALARVIAEDIANGFRPFFLSATIGSTATGGFDRLEPIADLCETHGIWLHADAAMFGVAALCPEYRYLLDGIGRVDSVTVNAHKWMLTGFDCNCFWVADRQALTGALGILPEYLKDGADAVVDYRDWQIPLGRRFRALKLWFVLRYHGSEALRAMVRRHVALAQALAGWITEDPEFEIAAPHPLTLVCFRHRGGDATNQALMDKLNASGDLYLTHCRLDGKLTLRFCVGQATTTADHVRDAWRAIQATARETC